MKAKTWFKIHSYVALFLLPVALLYVVTGAVELLRSDEHHEQRYRYGHAWEGQREASDEDEEGSGLYSELLDLHQGQGGIVARGFGLLSAVAFVVIYISGICMTWKSSVHRKRMLIFACAGLVVTVIVLMLR